MSNYPDDMQHDELEGDSIAQLELNATQDEWDDIKVDILKLAIRLQSALSIVDDFGTKADYNKFEEVVDTLFGAADDVGEFAGNIRKEHSYE